MYLDKKRNRRTLKKRIRRTIYLSSTLTILLYTCVLLVLLSLLFRPLSGFASNMIGHGIAQQMNAESFLREHHIDKLTDFKPDERWIKEMDQTARLDNYLSNEAKQHWDEGVIKASSDQDDSTIAWNRDFDLVMLKVELNGQTIYSNEEQLNSKNDMDLGHFNRLYAVESTFSLLDDAGETVGTVTAMIAPQVTAMLFLTAAAIFIIIMLFALLISKWVGGLITIPVLKPLDQLNQKMRDIASVQDISNVDTQIVLIKPLREIDELAGSANAIMQKLQGYNALLEDQKQTVEEQNEELEAQNEELVESERKLQDAQQRIERSERAVRMLLDNAGEGFMSFGSDLVVSSEYSRECENLFGQAIGGLSFPELVAQGEGEQKRFLENVLHKLFVETDLHKRDVYFSLLSEETDINGRSIHLDYRMIPDTDAPGGLTVMVVLRDITDKRELQSQMENERNTLNMVVKVIVGYGDFTDCVRDFRTFVEIELPDMLRSNESAETTLRQLFRDIHTYKGNFAQFGLNQLVQYLHDAESVLSGLSEHADTLTREQLVDATRSFRFSEWLEDEMRVLRSVLGDTFFDCDDMLLVDKTRILEFERRMIELLSPSEINLLLPELRKLRYKPFKDLLRSYPTYVQGLAERMEKLVAPFEFEGGDFFADTEKYNDFSRSLIHVFRNIVDHAVELPEERVEAGKDECGQIQCSLVLQEGEITVTISDDGRGIDASLIRRKAVEKGIVTQEAADAMEHEEIMQLLFHDEFSTREQVSDLSGRGVGLSAVRAEVERLGGRYEVESVMGHGTTFRFAIPFAELTGTPEIDFALMVEPAAAKTQEHFTQYAGVVLTQEGPFARTSDKIMLHRATSFIRLKGAVEGFCILSIAEPVALAVVRQMVLEPLAPEEEMELMEESLAETTNIILGNSFSMFRQLADFVIMEPPVTMNTEGASVKYADSEIWTCSFSSTLGPVKLCFVRLHKPV